ncbi:hypothetical protein EVA_16539 [gut metagenome]|uniref:Uncharacterized protein n=1 Tax=gut metagenome TaxID=749906 RepID=J9G791_9ZZZZ
MAEEALQRLVGQFVGIAVEESFAIVVPHAFPFPFHFPVDRDAGHCVGSQAELDIPFRFQFMFVFDRERMAVGMVCARHVILLHFSMAIPSVVVHEVEIRRNIILERMASLSGVPLVFIACRPHLLFSLSAASTAGDAVDAAVMDEAVIVAEVGRDKHRVGGREIGGIPSDEVSVVGFISQFCFAKPSFEESRFDFQVEHIVFVVVLFFGAFFEVVSLIVGLDIFYRLGRYSLGEEGGIAKEFLALHQDAYGFAHPFEFSVFLVHTGQL